MIYLHIGLTALLFYRLSTSQPKAARDSTEYVTTAPLQRSGAASGMLGTARLTGQTTGAVILAALFAVWPPHNGQGEVVALWLGAGCAVFSGVCSSLRVRAPQGAGH